jgi:hypothetical protein
MGAKTSTQDNSRQNEKIRSGQLNGHNSKVTGQSSVSEGNRVGGDEGPSSMAMDMYIFVERSSLQKDSQKNSAVLF